MCITSRPALAPRQRRRPPNPKAAFRQVSVALVAAAFTLLVSLAQAASALTGNQKISNFNEAKKEAVKIHQDHQVTVYCPCRYQGKTVDLRSCGYKVHKDANRAARLEWEHIVPAEAFGQSFREWREGDPKCRKRNGKAFKGRKCAEKNPLFVHMESDLHNLWPIVGELNGLRSNFSMAVIAGDALTFGDCKARIKGRKFEPMDEFKGIVARDYMYMEANYPGHGIISEKNRKLFESWDRGHTPTDWECRRAKLIEAVQGNENQVLKERCKGD
jgi:deoxyribonuclease-1